MTQFGGVEIDMNVEESVGLGDSLRPLSGLDAFREDPSQMDAFQRGQKMGVGEMMFEFASEAVSEGAEQLGDAILFAPRAISAMSSELEAFVVSKASGIPRDTALRTVQQNPMRQMIRGVGEAVTGVDFAPTMEQLGAERAQAAAEKPPSPFDSLDPYFTPQDIGNLGSNVLLGAATILSGGLAAPLTVPAMGSLAMEEVMGEYAQHLHENDDEFNPLIGGALLSIVALETVGSKFALVDLPTFIAKRSGFEGFKKILKAGSKEARRSAIKSVAKAVAARGGAMAVEGAEEMAEEAIEGLAQIMYLPELAHLRESILDGSMGADEWKEAWDIATAAGIKPGLLGAGGGGVSQLVADAKYRRPMKRAQRKEAEAAEAEALVADVRAEAAVRDAGPEVGVEAVEPDVIEESQRTEVTFSDLNSDQFADALVSDRSEVIEDLVLTPKTRQIRAQPPGRAKWGGIIPKGVHTTAAQRKEIWERILAARERATQAEAGPEIQAVAETVEAPSAEPESPTDALLREQAQLEELMTEEGVESDLYDSYAARLAEVDEQLGALGVEFSRVIPGREQGVPVRDLDIEPGTQRGSQQGGLSTDRRTGRRNYTKRYPNPEQARSEIIANRLYQAAGINVPNTQPVLEGGEVVGVTSEVIEGLSQGVARDAGDGLVIDAWLANWDVVGEAQDNLLVGPQGEAVRLDQGGALTMRAMGKPKGDRFTDTVEEITTLREQNPELAGVSPAQLRRGFVALESIASQDIKRIVLENGGDNALVRKLIKRRQDLLGRMGEVIDGSDLELTRAEIELDLAKINRNEGTDYAALTEEQIATLTEGEREIARNARGRLGREVVFITPASGVFPHNGFIQRGTNPNRIYIVVVPDAARAIKEVAKRKGLRERRVQEAYEMALMQTLLHENIHLLDDPGGQQFEIEDAASKVLTHILQKRQNQNRIEYLLDEYGRGRITEDTFDRELRAESLTDMVALSNSGIEVLFLNRGLVRNTFSRIRMLANRLGGRKDVRTITRVVSNMDRGDGFIPADPSDIVELSRAFPVVPGDQLGIGFTVDVAKKNPTPDNLLMLLVLDRAFTKLDKDGKPKARKPKADEAKKALEVAGFDDIDDMTAKHISSSYLDTFKFVHGREGKMTELRGEHDQFSAAGAIERAGENLFFRNFSPTAEELKDLPGSPRPRSGVSVANMTDTKKQPWSQVREDSFIKNIYDTLEVIGGRLTETKSAEKIDSLLKKYDVVIYTGEGGPAVHANQSWTDKFAQPTDYAKIKEATIKALDGGFHNWYREFGVFFKSFGGDALVNEAAMVFGVTSSQSAVENNIADTLHIMRLVREHVRDGKPWTKNALKETVYPFKLNKKGKRYKVDDKWARGDARRTKHTASGTASMFISEKQIDTIIGFYIDGVPPEGGAIKTRTYSGSIALSANNEHNNLSVQDRHQAALYGFFQGAFNKSNGKFSYDKVFRSEQGYRYAAYLTQRLSNEPEIRPLSPQQVQAAQWFYTKAGEGPYSEELEAKTDTGLIANFARDNPDLRTGTLQSALRFADFEIADLRALMADAPDNVRFPAADLLVPTYVNTLYSGLDYASGQGIAREFAKVMAAEGPRLVTRVYPSIEFPGLSAPAEPLGPAKVDELTTGILQGITEANGTVRLFNDMGLPHSAMVSLTGITNGVAGRSFALTPMVGSISSPSVAKVVASAMGLGLMQSRVATIYAAPEGGSVTLRIRKADGTQFTDGDMSVFTKYTEPFSDKGVGEIWQMLSPAEDFVDVTLNPTAQRVSRKAAETKYADIQKGFLDDTGIEITTEVHRAEVEVIEQSQYRGNVEGSGLRFPIAGQPGVLNRILAEITTPALSSLRSFGYGFNRDAYQSGLGVSREVVEDLPTEFSRVVPIISLEQANSLRKGSEETKAFKGRDNPLEEVQDAEARWWGSLTPKERYAVNFWMSSSAIHSSGLPEVSGDVPYDPPSEIREGFRSEFQDDAGYRGGHKYLRAVALERFGSWDWALGGEVQVLANGLFGNPEVPRNQEWYRKVMDEIGESINDGVASALSELRSSGLEPQGASDIFWRIDYTESGMPVLSDNQGNTWNAHDRDNVHADIESNFPITSIAANVANSFFTPAQTMALTRLPGNEWKEQVKQKQGIEALVIEKIQEKFSESLHPGNLVFDHLAEIYNEFLTAVSKSPKYEGDTYRAARKVSPSRFARDFPPGTRFRSAAPSSASYMRGEATSFATRASLVREAIAGKPWTGADESFFTVKSKTGRLLNMDTFEQGGIRRSERGRGIAEVQPTDRSPVSRTADAVGVAKYLESVGEPAMARNMLAQTEWYDYFSGANEAEILLMPGAVYEVTKQRGMLIEVKEVEVSPEEAATIPIIPEFSAAIPPPTEPVDALTAPSEKQLQWRQKGIRRTLQDRFVELDYLQRDIQDAFGGHLDIEMDPLTRLRSMPGRRAYKSERFAKRVMEPLAKGIGSSGLSLSEFGEYAAAVHALDANAELAGRPGAVAGIDSGLSDATANQIIARVSSHPNFQKIEQYRKKLVAIGRQNIRLALKAGLISKAEYDRLTGNFPNYVPFWDAMTEATAEAQDEFGVQQFQIPSQFLKARTGRETDALKGDTKFFEDRLAAMGDQRYQIIGKTENNEVLKRMLRLSDEVDDTTLFERFKPGMSPTVDETGATVMVPDNSWRTDPTVFRVMVDGSPVLLQIKHQGLAEALRARRAPLPAVIRTIMQTASLYTSLKRFYSTQFGNPDFTLRNPVRDVQTGSASMIGENQRLTKIDGERVRKLPLTDRIRIVLKGIPRLATSWSAMWGVATPRVRRQLARYRALGARQEFFDIADPAKSRKKIRKAIAKGKPTTIPGAPQLKAVLLSPKAFVDLWQHVNTMFDDGVRFTAWRGLIEQGVNQEKAVEVSRDLTVDFSRMGTAGRTVNSMYAFANASAQGTTKTMRLLKSPAGAGIFGAYFMAGLMSEIWNSDDRDCDGNLKKDWEEIPDWERDSNLFLTVPQDCETGGKATYVKVPIAYGLAIPYVAGRRLIRWMRGEEEWTEAAAATAMATWSNLNPLGGEVIPTDDPKKAMSAGMRLLSPDITDPFIGLATNQDWLGNRIYNEPLPTFMDPTPVRSEMGRDSTAQWAKDVAGWVNTMTGGDDVQAGAIDFQPEMLTYILGDVFSGAYRTTDRIGKMFQKQWIDSQYGEELSEEIRWDEIPGVRPFLTTTPRPKDLQNSYYEYRDVSDKAADAMKEYAESGRREEARGVFEEARAPLAAKDYYKQIQKMTKDMRTRLRILKEKGASQEDILRERKKWTDRINTAKQRVVKAVRKVEQSGG